MALKMIKLVTGEVVLGTAGKEFQASIELEKPMTMMLDPMQGGVGMIPYDAIYTQEECESKVFLIEHIVDMDMTIHSTFEDAYIKQTTGIETVTPEIIA